MYGKVDSLETITERLEIITADDILTVAREIFDDEKFSSLIYQ
jgi:predicted Zn-dependent peptidase